MDVNGVTQIQPNTERTASLRDSLNQAKQKQPAPVVTQVKPRALAGSISSRMQIDPSTVESTLASSRENEESQRRSKTK